VSLTGGLDADQVAFGRRDESLVVDAGFGRFAGCFELVSKVTPMRRLPLSVVGGLEIIAASRLQMAHCGPRVTSVGGRGLGVGLRTSKEVFEENLGGRLRAVFNGPSNVR
jgi:hypothetical protein